MSQLTLFKLAKVFANCWAVKGLVREEGTVGPAEELGPAEEEGTPSRTETTGMEGSSV